MSTDNCDFGAVMDLPVIATVYANSGTGTLNAANQGNYWDFGSTFVDTGGSWAGPVYQIGNPTIRCGQAALNTVGDQLRGLAEAIVGGLAVNCLQQGCQTVIVNAARGVIAGTVSAAAFADVILAIISAIDLPAILAAGGVTVGLDLIYQYMNCLLGGG